MTLRTYVRVDGREVMLHYQQVHGGVLWWCEPNHARLREVVRRVFPASTWDVLPGCRPGWYAPRVSIDAMQYWAEFDLPRLLRD